MRIIGTIFPAIILLVSVVSSASFGDTQWSFSIKAREGFRVRLGQQGNFELLNPDNFVALTKEGQFSATPELGDVGHYTYKIRITVDSFVVERALNLNVLPNPIPPPTWALNPITFEVRVGQKFKADVCRFATNVEGVSLACQKVSGPPWLSVGEFLAAGTPSNAYLGENLFVLSACDEDRCSNTALSIKVSK